MPAGDARPAIGGILTAEQIVATGASIAAVQQRDGGIGWPDGHIDAWNHTECAMALSVCGLRAERGPPTGGWPRRSGPTGPGPRPPWPGR
jgi:hypothetical protein